MENILLAVLKNCLINACPRYTLYQMVREIMMHNIFTGVTLILPSLENPSLIMSSMFFHQTMKTPQNLVLA
ncbi:hypothetical protein PR202_ga07919 [Eleusine coracana subsp. coracana]|uniref:Uncharacterized protein n=1 Tax=Eleusine coracana subsp. coracana TaxID=191504 RepID=A0AAV5C1W6_ELECO|nr:hypothetical protein PR202_ga07919 [Eleusine coracana subsp. coracana]